MSEETISVVVCHEGTPSNTYTLHETDLNLVMETIGRVIGWRSMEDRIAAALGKMVDDGLARALEERIGGLRVGEFDTVVKVDMTVDKHILIALEGEGLLFERPDDYTTRSHV